LLSLVIESVRVLCDRPNVIPNVFRTYMTSLDVRNTDRNSECPGVGINTSP